MHEVRFQEGEAIFTEGDRGEHCYKIVSGTVEISMDTRGLMSRKRKEAIATCGAGDFIGEMSLIAGGPRSASARAIAPTVCMAYSAEEVLAALQNDPEEALAYVRTLIARLRHSNRMISAPAMRRG